MPSIDVIDRRISSLRRRQRYPRRHSSEQISKIARSIEKFGFWNPILIDDDNNVVVGIGRLEAAQTLGHKTVPTIQLSQLSDADKRALAIADNKIAELSSWDSELLALELQDLSELNFDMEFTGFATGEIDLILQEFQEEVTDSHESIPPIQRTQIVTQFGDIWQLGRHSLICGDALETQTYEKILDSKKADCVFTDPPYNVPIVGHVTKTGRHDNFQMACGELSESQFIGFLTSFLNNAITASRAGAVHFICMDWRHLYEIISAARDRYGSFLNLCVWNKTNGGMGSLYRSKHELVLVFQVGDVGHCNNVKLGKYGRNRTNVWDYAGANSFGSSRLDELDMHPTVKPTALVADAIKDTTKRGDLVLDPFAGSGTTIIAAEKCGRTAAAIEIDPAYVDVIVKRWQQSTGEAARLSANGSTFDDVNHIRRHAPATKRATTRVRRGDL
jgi:DNA modification methylase